MARKKTSKTSTKETFSKLFSESGIIEDVVASTPTATITETRPDLKATAITKTTKSELTPESDQFLSAEELLCGGDNPFKEVYLESAKKNGLPGIAVLGPVQAIELARMTENREAQSDQEKQASVFRFIGVSLKDPKTKDPLLSEKQLDNILSVMSIRVLNELTPIVFAFHGLDPGEKGTVSTDPPPN